jgi:hypothetical protein
VNVTRQATAPTSGNLETGTEVEAALVGPDVWFTILLVSLPSPPRHVNLCDDTPRTPAMAAVSTKSKEPIAMGIRNTPDWSWPGVLRVQRVLVRVAVVMTVAVLVFVGGLFQHRRLGDLQLQPRARCQSITRRLSASRLVLTQRLHEVD